MEDTRTRAAANPQSSPPGPPRPPVRSYPGMLPALVVVGLALVVLIIFGVAAGVTNKDSGQPSRHNSPPAAVKGTTLLAVPAASLLRPIEQPGEPPANILDAVSVPQGARAVAFADYSSNSRQYDQQMTFVVHSSQAEVIDFYRAQMPTQRWRVFSTGAAAHQPGAIEVLGRRAGDDGWYWDLGAVVLPTTFPTGTGVAPGTNSTRFTLRLIQLPDQA